MGASNNQSDRIRAYAKLIEAQTGRAVRPFRKDGYVNLLNRYGTAKDSAEQYRFVAEPMIPDDMLTMHYEGNGLFAKIIDAPAEEAVKHGFKLADISDEQTEAFYQEALDELDWEEVFMTGIKWARLFGGAIGVMLINDGGALEDPLNWKNIKSIDDIRIYDRSVIQPDYQSMYTYNREDPFRTRGSRLGTPERYFVSSKYGNFVVHESRCLLFQNGILPENCTNSIYQFWGIPEYVRLHRALRDAEIAHGTAPKMLDRSVQAVYKMKDLSAELATEEGEGKVLRRLQTIDMARGLLNSITIDSEGEDYDFRTFQFSGVSDVIDATCNFLSALSNIPQTILFGRSPAGMNATGESDLENWYNFVDRIRAKNIRSNLRYLLSVIFQAGVSTGEINEVPKIKIEFNPLWSLSDVEQADLDNKRANTELVKAQTAQAYIDMQVYDPSEIRKKLAQANDFEIDDVISEEDLEEDFFASLEETAEPTTRLAANPDAVHETKTAAEGSTPTNAPAATKLPQDMTAQEIGEVAKNTDEDDAVWNPFGVGVLVIKDGKILTGTRHNDSGYGLIGGPGGHGEEGESPEEAAFRETEEEFGISAKELIPIGLGPFEPESGLQSHLFICTEYDGEPDCVDMEMVNPKFRTLEELEQLDASLFPPFKDSLEILKRELCGKRDDGGPGSGNWGHAGRPGKKGGSSGGGGAHNRMGSSEEGYTSFSKEKKKMAKPHKLSHEELSKCPNGTVIAGMAGHYKKAKIEVWNNETFDYEFKEGFVSDDWGDFLEIDQVISAAGNDSYGLAIPDSANKNYLKPKGDPFSDERRTNAFKASEARDADDLLREKSGHIWRGLDDASKDALVGYTGETYFDINSGLRNGYNVSDSIRKDTELLTNAISQSVLDRDMYLFRGTSSSAAEKLFGLKSGDLATWSGQIEDLSTLVGTRGIDNGFLSCGTSEGKGFTSRDVQLKIYCPAGTQALYAEPFSAFGRGDQRSWDGISKQNSFSSENETILQRGCELRIVGAEWSGNKAILEVEVLSQMNNTIKSDGDDLDGFSKSSNPDNLEKHLDFYGQSATIKSQDNFDGGSGSGNHGHRGVKGQRGGSAAKSSHPKVTKFTTQNGRMKITSDLKVKASKSGKVSVTIKAGQEIEGIYSFAGKGSNANLVVSGTLSKQYGGKPKDWSHLCGYATVVNSNGSQERAEIHWFEHETVGQINFKVKKR